MSFIYSLIARVNKVNSNFYDSSATPGGLQILQSQPFRNLHRHLKRSETYTSNFDTRNLRATLIVLVAWSRRIEYVREKKVHTHTYTRRVEGLTERWRSPGGKCSSRGESLYGASTRDGDGFCGTIPRGRKVRCRGARRAEEESALAAKEGKWGGKRVERRGGGRFTRSRAFYVFTAAYTLARASRITHRLVTHIQLIFR